MVTIKETLHKDRASTMKHYYNKHYDMTGEGTVNIRIL